MREDNVRKRLLDFLLADPEGSYSVDELLAVAGTDSVGCVRNALTKLYKEGLAGRERKGHSYFYSAAHASMKGKRPGGYSTRQGKAVRQFFIDHPGHFFSAEDVVEGVGVLSRATAYRVIGSLERDGVVISSTDHKRGRTWQYAGRDDCKGHLHVECERCGRVEHIDMMRSRKINELVGDATGYEALNDTVIKGLCPECKGKEG